jgi:hypothetical protein
MKNNLIAAYADRNAITSTGKVYCLLKDKDMRAPRIIIDF